jgi:Heat shock transcription factor
VKKLQHIIGWQPHGRSFCIRNPGEFESGLMTTFFAQTQLTSFRRQLNLYDFKRITHGPDAGSYYHELFMRGKPLHAYRIKRTKVKGTKYRSTSSPEEEPDFYSMPALPPCYDPQTGEEQQPYLIGHLILDNQHIQQEQNPSAPAGQEGQPAQAHNDHRESWKSASDAAAAAAPVASFRHSEYPHAYSKKASSTRRNNDADSSGFAMAGGIMGGTIDSSRMLATGFSSAAAVPLVPGANRTTTREKNSRSASDHGSSSVSSSNYVSPEPSSVGGGNTSSSLCPATGSASNKSINGGSGVTNIVAGLHPLPAPIAANSSFGFTPITTATTTNAFPQQQQSILGSSFAGSTGNQNNTLKTLEQLKVLLGLGNNNEQQKNQHDLVNEAIYSLLVNTTLANEAERGYGRPGGDGIDLSALLILVQQEQQRRRQQQEQRDRQIIELLASLSSRNNLAPPPPANQRFDNAFHTNPVAGDNLLNFIRDNSQQNTNYCAAPPIGAPSDGGSTNTLLLSALLQQSYPSSDHANNLMISPASSSMPIRNGLAQTPMGPQAPYFYDQAPTQNSRNGVGVNEPRGNGIPAGLGYTGRNLENLETGRSSTEGLGALNVGADHSGLNLMHIMSAYNALHGNHISSARMSAGSTCNGNSLSYYSGDPMSRSSHTHDNASSQRQL